MIVRHRGSPEGGGTACSRVSNADVVARSRLGGVSPLIQGVTDRAPPANGVVRVPAVDGTGATTKSSGNINRDAAAYAASSDSASWCAPNESSVTKYVGRPRTEATQWWAPNPTGRCSTPSTSGVQWSRIADRTSPSDTSGGGSRTRSPKHEPVPRRGRCI